MTSDIVEKIYLILKDFLEDEIFEKIKNQIYIQLADYEIRRVDAIIKEM